MPLERGGYTAEILCDGQEIPQYQVDTVSDTTISCYVPSQAGKNFIIRIKDLTSKEIDGFSAILRCDGRLLGNYIGFPGKARDISEIQTSATTLQHLAFSKVQFVSDDAEVTAVDAVARSLGLIQVKVYSAYMVDRPTPTPVVDTQDVGLVSELSKVVGFNQVSLGTARVTVSKQQNKTWYARTETDGHDPLAVFEFRHRPAGKSSLEQQHLQAMGVIPKPPPRDDVPGPTAPGKRLRSPSSAQGQPRKASRTDKQNTPHTSSPEVEGEDIKPSTTDDEEDAVLRSLQETIQLAQSQMESIRARRGDNSRVKRERAPSPIRVGSANGEVIDLTID
ncbi:hypothetical protein BC834DRAFT_966536 [Gloeopeniophorella convolvens]|nr:hypothetical protein BC834DRAFT_966536 [Gloeopeniophorella convolvens]